MPKSISLAIIWDGLGFSSYVMHQKELEEMVDNYAHMIEGEQLNLFTHFPIEVMRQWVWDAFAREPKEVSVDQIVY